MLKVNIESNFISEELVPVEDHFFCPKPWFQSTNVERGEGKRNERKIKVLKCEIRKK